VKEKCVIVNPPTSNAIPKKTYHIPNTRHHTVPSDDPSPEWWSYSKFYIGYTSASAKPSPACTKKSCDGPEKNKHPNADNVLSSYPVTKSASCRHHQTTAQQQLSPHPLQSSMSPTRRKCSTHRHRCAT
jgi:hypothetical protein